MSRGFKLAGYVALAYTLVIVYASLQPFTGWRAPPDEVLHFLTAPWPRYLTAGDITLNVIAYLPLGAMLFFALRPPLAAAVACLLAILIAAALSLALESIQMFLPTRIASNVDLISNSAGAAIGALGALLLTLWNNPLAALRRRVVRADNLGDVGLLVVALWILVQFDPARLALSSGDLRDTLGITPMFTHTSHAYLLAEAAVAALAVLAMGLLVSLLMQSRRYALRAMALTLLLTLTAKSIAAILLGRAASWLQWLTPGVALGLAAGGIVVLLLLWLAPMARAMSAILCLVAGVVVVNVTPENPYQMLPAHLLSVQPTHLSNFGNIVRTLSMCWPFAAFVLLLALTRTRAGASGYNSP
jgi:VanZ family protein